MKTATAAILLAATPALAQQTQPNGAATTPPPTDQRQRIEPGASNAAETADEIAERMFTSGGSLLQAQLDTEAARRVPATGIDDRISFFAVPEPAPTILRPHDLVTVVVREESASKSAGKTELEKEYELDAVLREYLDIDLSDLRLGTREGNQRISGEAERSFSGDGSTDRKDSFVTRLTAEVLDVKPNGTVVLQARKRIQNDDDEQVFILTGICRTEDITPDNTVLSTQLHDLNLEKHTKGPVRDATRRGFIPRLIDRINPF